MRLIGDRKLMDALRHKSDTNFDEVAEQTTESIRDRAKRTGGTPRDTGALSASVGISNGGKTVGYDKDYAAAVEFGHRTKGGGTVPGRYYLKQNVNTQRELFRTDLLKRMKGRG